MSTAADPSRPDLVVTSPDGTRIAGVRSGMQDGPPVVLIHGASADHTTFRVLGPRLATTFDVVAIDRRGRGASGDTLPYSIEREFEDVAAVAAQLASERGRPVDLIGHSYGGRIALGAALRTDAIRRVVCYEGAPAPPGVRYGDHPLVGELLRLAAAGDLETLLATFMTRVVGMDAAALAAYRADPVWPRRVAAAGTIARELGAEADPAAAGLDTLGGVRQPVLLVLGGDSLPAFRLSTHALAARLTTVRVAVIPGARHAAHHTHVAPLESAIRDFLDAPVEAITQTT